MEKNAEKYNNCEKLLKLMTGHNNQLQNILKEQIEFINKIEILLPEIKSKPRMSQIMNLNQKKKKKISKKKSKKRKRKIN